MQHFDVPQSLYLGTRAVKGEFQFKVLGLVQQITENRNMHAVGPVPTSNLLHYLMAAHHVWFPIILNCINLRTSE